MNSPVSQGAAKPWSYVQERDADFDELHDFVKELYSIPDKGNTTVQMMLTFDIEAHTASYRLFLYNDITKTADLEMPMGRNDVPWEVALEMLGDEAQTLQARIAEANQSAADAATARTEARERVPAALALEISQAYTYAALSKLHRDVDACSGIVVKTRNPLEEIVLTEAQIGSIVDALDFQLTGKPDFISKRELAVPLAWKIDDAYDVRVEVGGPEKYRYLDQAECAVIIAALDDMSKARNSTFLNDGIDDSGQVFGHLFYHGGYPWQTGYDIVASGGSVAMDNTAIKLCAHLYTPDGVILRDAIRHAEIVGDPVPKAAYDRLQTLTAEASVSQQWADPNFREAMRTGAVAVAEPRLHGLSLPHVGAEQIGKLTRDTLIDEWSLRQSLSALCNLFTTSAIPHELERLLLADEFVHDTLRRAAGVWEYVQWAKDDSKEVFKDTLREAMRMWAVAHIVAERPESVTTLSTSMRSGEDPYFNGYFGAGAARWEPATFIADKEFVAARTDASGLTHTVLFVGNCESYRDPFQRVPRIDQVIDALHKHPGIGGQFGSLLIERGFPKQVSPELAQSALEVVEANCTDINDSRAILKADALGFQAGTDVKQVVAWLKEHGATANLTADNRAIKQSTPDNGPSAP